LDRASDFGSVGCRFKSYRAHQYYTLIILRFDRSSRIIPQLGHCLKWGPDASICFLLGQKTLSMSGEGFIAEFRDCDKKQEKKSCGSDITCFYLFSQVVFKSSIQRCFLYTKFGHTGFSNSSCAIAKVMKCLPCC
jgi:hypothetical protein